ncbi:hypothetical protein E0W68_12850 [Flavobacterium salilacus subsp. salilacus]|uniref:RHS repeat-associated core domain-containing protein n=1 Tax=Flavobacterium TaxID=237 RepID=UPI001074B8B9|nr:MULTISPECIES: FG-GAP-like repeat-containing protein [Flavobacterium]KAF2515833.1 hypothetical protein E0W68_12850 [Flavobacterium salilacus subsp. salilacus]MBE1615362.1 VCBS repeat-containing protein [Flavobacterium sp. SaA2.13]
MKKYIYISLFLISSLYLSGQNIGVSEQGVTVLHYSEPESSPASEENYTALSTTTAGTPTGNSPEVGITGGTLSVSLSGSATYNIPFALPPGINGVVPEIGLSYNSNSGNGYAGYGWNVSGLSSITRIPATIYHDNIIDGVDYNSLDRFALDGQRLILKSGTYGAADSVYETENFSNIKITAIGTTFLSSPAYFKVEYPDGSFALYGNGTNGYARNEWAITSWQNTQGLTITYGYMKDYGQNSIRIAFIRYGPIADEEDSLNEINFRYEERDRSENGYVGDHLYEIDNILKEVRIEGGNVPYRNYYLAYDTTTLGYQRLTSITEKSGDNTKSYNPTVFTYSNTSNSIQYSSNTSANIGHDIAVTNSIAQASDFNGDGEMDFLLYATSGTLNKNIYWIYSNINSPSGANLVEHAVGNFEAILPVNLLYEDDNNEFLLEKSGWTVIKKLSSSYQFTSRAMGGSFSINILDDFSISNTDLGGTNNKNFYSGDFNGDGLTDIFCIPQASTATYFINLDRRLAIHENYSGSLIESIGNNDKVLISDFNGDGKSDILHFKSHKLYVYTLNSQDVLVNLVQITNDSSIIVNDATQIMLGDYNGDGKADFIIPKGSGYTEYRKYTSTGTSYLKTIEEFPSFYYAPGNELNSRHYIPTDYNNDGKSDLLEISASGALGSAGQVVVKCFINKDGNFSGTAGNYITYNTGSQSGLDSFAMPIFLTSDKYNPGKEIAVVRGNKLMYFKSLKDFNSEKLLRSITTGNGVTESITYTSLGACPSCMDYSIDTENKVAFPNYDIIANPSQNIVTKLERESSQGTQKQIYRYLGAVSNLEGQGFLGFKSILKTNWHQDNSEVISNVTKFDVLNHGVVIEQITVAGWASLYTSYAPPTFISKSSFSNDNTLTASKVFNSNLVYSTVHDGLNNTSKISAYIYDSYNNVLTLGYVLKKGAQTQKTGGYFYEYFNDPLGSTYYIGRLKKLNTTETQDEVTLTTESQYSYTDNLLTQKKVKGHETGFITEDFEYDDYGNLIQKTLSASGLPNRTTSFEYDVDGRFMIESTDVQGLSTSYTYDNSTGLVSTITDPYNNVTQFLYDEWGKNTRIVDYLDKSTLIIYNALPSGMSEIKITNDDGSSSYSMFDDLGRNFITGNKNIDDTWSYTKTEYDYLNRPVSISEPYSDISSSPSQFSTIDYDLYGRVIESVSYTGKVTNISYSPLTTTIDDGIQTSVVVKNAAGNIISKTDEGGTINYFYYPDGNLKQTNYDEVIISILQDGWGRRKKLTDPSAGVYEYEYDNYGQLKKYTNPKGYSEYTYDSTGKINYKLDVEGNYYASVDYYYDPTTKLLTGEEWYDSEGEGHGMFYTYDEKMRINYAEETATYANFQHTYTYDEFGRIEKETIYADNDASQSATKVVRNTYKNGYNWQILDDVSNQLLWQNSTVNERGQLTKGKYGNNIEVTNTYDSYGFLAETKHGDIMLLTTVFDAQRGNLTSRTNSMFNWDESFDYDNLDRLIKYTNARGEQEIQSYDNKGRITENILGEYTYDQTKVYQQSTVEITDAAISYYVNKVGIFSRSMENKDGWNITNPSDTSYDTSKARTGDYSLKLSASSSQSVNTDTGVKIINPTTTQYTVSGWFYSEGPSVRLYLVMQTEAQMANGTSTISYVTDATTAGWKYIQKIVSVPSSVRFLSTRVYKSGAGNAWFDDVRIVKTADATESRELNIEYNMYKSPVEIYETGVDRISFSYNCQNSRSAMFYGSTNSDKLARPYRKFYSLYGDIEIKHSVVDNVFEFIFYIGGDGYSAPVIFKKKNTAEEYLYLHRDYLGSIVAISNQAGNIVEKRLFDAWGNLLKVQDGLGKSLPGLVALDRGYTGHEHLQSINIIHMNGRLYDPVTHRFLQPDNYIQDPSNSQNYNRYGYALNNPLRYVDYNGEQSSDIYVTPSYNVPNDYSNVEREGTGNGLIDAIIAGISYTVDNWDDWKIKDWFNDNFSNGVKDAGTWVGNQVRSGKGWVNTNLRSIRNDIGLGRNEYSMVHSQYSGHSEGAWQGSSFREYGNNALAFAAGFVNSFGSNQFLGVGRYNHPESFGRYELAFRFGALAGDILSMVSGTQEMAAGGKMMALGLLATVETGPIGISIAVGGGAVMLHGGAVAFTGASNTIGSLRGIIDYMAKPKNNPYGNGNGRPRMGNNRAKNEEVNSLSREYKLSDSEQRELHDYITGQGYSRSEIEEIIRTGEYKMR